MAGIEGRALAFPFSINASGFIAYNENDNVIWEDRVRCVLLTNLTERVMRPDFGSRLAALTFENETSISSLAEKIVSFAFAMWLPSLTLDSVLAYPDESSNGIIVQVVYTTPVGYTEALTLKTVTLNRYGEIVQGG
jgi:phage baseplate assembly protein W